MIIKGDKVQLQQLVINLINNARDAILDAPKPEIICSFKRYDATDAFVKANPELTKRAFTRLTISDNGTGIPQQQLENIFEPFYTTKDPGKGTGLGLAMAYGCVKSHGGVIDVESEPGHGTTFHIYLPLTQQSIKKSVTVDTETMAYGDGETILLVDDEAFMRETTGEVLRSLNYKVLEANNGEQALALYEAKRKAVKLIFTDVVMPSMGGDELATAIRLIDPNIPIIFVSGYDKEKVFSNERHVSRSEILEKPFSFHKASHLIQELLKP